MLFNYNFEAHYSEMKNTENFVARIIRSITQDNLYKKPLRKADKRKNENSQSKFKAYLHK